MAIPITQAILNAIVTELQAITIANGYRTNIEHVVAGKIVTREVAPSAWRNCFACVVYISESFSRDEAADHVIESSPVYGIHISMDNTTSEEFLGVLDDIHNALELKPRLGSMLSTDIYGLLWVRLTSIDISASPEFDEVVSDNDGPYMSREGYLTLGTKVLKAYI